MRYILAATSSFSLHSYSLPTCMKIFKVYRVIAYNYVLCIMFNTFARFSIFHGQMKILLF
jgi:hypothetical protein